MITMQLKVMEMLADKQTKLERISYNKNSKKYFKTSKAFTEEIAAFKDILKKIKEVKTLVVTGEEN